MKLKELSYYLKYGIETVILGKKKPVVAGIALTDLCNLKCKHCVVIHGGQGHYSLSKLIEWMELFYKRGARILYLQGGEPFTWHENGKNLDDVIKIGREIGFFKVAIASNGTFPIETKADIVWISIDGTPERHNEIRGEGVFEKVMSNVENSSHRNICANTTVNNINYVDVEEVVKLIGGHSKFRGISINFHTPYPGVEHLALTREQRAEVIEKVIKLKEKGYNILNSKDGLKALSKGNYRRPIWMIQMIDKGEIHECCFGRDCGKVCEECGYGVIAELSQLFSLKPSSIIHSLSLFGDRG